MAKVIYVIFTVLTFISISCASSGTAEDKPEVGEKDGVCYSEGTCNSGLVCIDLVCKDDPCYQVQCEEFKECREGICEFENNRCKLNSDCHDENALCVENVCAVPSNNCQHQNCSGKGTCQLDGNTGEASCKCDPGYNNDAKPLACEKDVEVNLCENSACDPWKTCNPDNGNCDLVPGRCGTKSDCIGDKICDANNNCVNPSDPCEGVTCNNHGACEVANGLAKCDCLIVDGYYPDSTGLNCSNPCDGKENCGGFGICIPSNATTAICQCNDGYEDAGSNLTCVKLDLCENVNCSEWKPCNDTTGQCTLATNRCDSNNDCSAGKECDANHNCITPNNPCDGVSCSNHGSCLIDGDQAVCNCDTANGYYPSGLSCLNPCDGETCSNQGTCIPSNATTAVCQCNNGYHAVDLTCIEDDPCANVTCNDSWKECRNGTCELITGKCDSASDCSTTTPACVSNTCIDRCDNLNCNTTNTDECLSDATDAYCICNTGYDGDLCNDCATGYQDNNGTCEAISIWCNLQSPTTVNQEKDTTGELVFGRVYVSGTTEASTESPTIRGELGYTLDDVTLPINHNDYIWISASYNDSCSNCGNNDEYMANIPTDMVGSFKYIYRFSMDSGVNWLYCDSNGVGGVDNVPFETNLVGTATITEPVTSNGTLIFSEVVDHKETANAKYVEVYNASSSAIELEGWKVNRYANGGNTPMTYTFTANSLTSSTAFVVTSSMTEFNTVFGFDANASSAAISGNGDDVYVLLNPSGDIVDIYGVVGVDGTNEAWEYTDSVAKRNINITEGNAIWTANEWTITLGSGDATPAVR